MVCAQPNDETWLFLPLRYAMVLGVYHDTLLAADRQYRRRLWPFSLLRFYYFQELDPVWRRRIRRVHPFQTGWGEGQ